jgi:hypothetical protein
MKKTNKLLISTISMLGGCAIVAPVVTSCAGSVCLRLSTTGFDVTNRIQPDNFYGDDVDTIHQASDGLDAWNKLSNKNKTLDLFSTIFKIGSGVTPYLKNDFFSINFKTNK